MVGKSAGIGIGVGLVVVAIIGLVAYTQQGNTFSPPVTSSSSPSTTSPAVPSSSGTTDTKPLFGKELIQVYNNCRTWMNTQSNAPLELQQAQVECYPDDVKYDIFDPPRTTLAKFKFATPDALKDSGVVCASCQSKVYKYGENDFELALLDEVGEKKYPVRLYELPA